MMKTSARKQRAAMKVAAELSQFVASTPAGGPLRIDAGSHHQQSQLQPQQPQQPHQPSPPQRDVGESQEMLLGRMTGEADFPTTLRGVHLPSLKFSMTVPSLGPEDEKAVFPFPISGDEAARVGVLESLLVLDTEQDPSFDNVTKLVGMIFNAPICLIPLLDTRRCWLKSRVGVEASEFKRDLGLCNYVILEESESIVQMLPLKDPVLKFVPAVQSFPIGFYAGCPLIVNHQKVGTLCFVDYKERPYLNEREQDIMKSLAKFVVDLLLLHQKRAQEALKAQNLAKERGVLLRTLGSLSSGALILDRTTADYRIVYANAGACKIYGCNEDQLLNRPFEEIAKGKDTNIDDLEKIRSAIHFGNRAVVVIQSDRLSKYAIASASPAISNSFWAKYVVSHSGSDFSGMSPAEGLFSEWSKPAKPETAEESSLHTNFCFIEITNEDKLAKASLETEAAKEEAQVAAESRRVLMINLAREIRSKLDIIVQAGSKLLTLTDTPAKTADTTPSNGNRDQLLDLSRLVVGNGLYLTSLVNTMAAHEIAAEERKRAAEHENEMSGESTKRIRRS